MNKERRYKFGRMVKIQKDLIAVLADFHRMSLFGKQLEFPLINWYGKWGAGQNELNLF
jgi:hypothetical protein